MRTSVFRTSGLFDTRRSFAQTFYGVAFVAAYGLVSCDIVVSVWCRWWKPWSERGLLWLSAASADMESPLVRCREEEGYQRRPALLLAEVLQSPKVLTFVTPDLLVLPKNFEHLYLAMNHSYWALEFYLVNREWGCQKIVGGCNNVVAFSVPAWNHVEYYCGFFSCRNQYEPPSLLITRLHSYWRIIVVWRSSVPPLIRPESRPSL